MAKKTRKQKILAELHKKNVFSVSVDNQRPVSNSLQNKSTTTTSFVKKDFAKTLILGSLFIGFEFILSLLFHKFGW